MDDLHTYFLEAVMRYAIIDIGSNTIRMVILELKGEKPVIIGNAREKSILLNCIYDRELDKRGISFLCRVLEKMKQQCTALDCTEIHAFATASLRKIENSHMVCGIVERHTGIKIRIITGSEEAEYDYEGLKYTKRTYDGIALDLGGGSCQIFRYANGGLLHKISMPIGSLRMYHAFVEKDIPSPKEAESLYRYITERMENLPEYRRLGFERIYTMGGTAQCAIQMYHGLYKEKNEGTLSVDKLRKMYEELVKKGQKSAYMIKNYFNDRINSLIPGMITLCAICDYAGASVIEEARCGVREGYMLKEIINARE